MNTCRIIFPNNQSISESEFMESAYKENDNNTIINFEAPEGFEKLIAKGILFDTKMNNDCMFIVQVRRGQTPFHFWTMNF